MRYIAKELLNENDDSHHVYHAWMTHLTPGIVFTTESEIPTGLIG